MEIRIIKHPSPGTLNILYRRKGTGKTELPENIDAVGLVQGRMIEMVVAADVAEKAVGVTVEDIHGSCPQNMILLALFGDTAAVESAIADIRKKL
ncbi:BMC domain-containing protein [Hornefia butyriciproducens]|uniref:BMC domain-containing protein n=1 Tax=Hornefia butyriciproducens TaxID=2652293 RepID=UPI002A91FDCB|nr:BMC domain-containing protein [Hornefia butyriciproducens]MDY6211442.1 BMC domain-containing protein [Hornefia butyriciproducens]